MTSSDTFVATKTFGALTMYSCVECGAAVLEEDRDSHSRIFSARQTHLDWHSTQSRSSEVHLQKEKCDE